MCFGFFASLMSKILNLWEGFLKVEENLRGVRNILTFEKILLWREL